MVVLRTLLQSVINTVTVNMLTLILFILVIVSYLLLRKKDAWRDSPPPHPPNHPLLGSLPTLKKLDPIAHLAFHSLSQTLGPILRLKLGRKWISLVSGFDEIKVKKNIF